MSAAARPGVFVAVVGPSGAGKDSILSLAGQWLSADPSFHFVRRVVTRPANGGEDHDSMTPLQFEAAQRDGRFAASWTANGLSYGIPAAETQALAHGVVVVANASREAAPAIKAAFPRSMIIHITASVETLRARLLARGREDADSVDLRLARSLMLEQGFAADIRIENNGALETAAKQFVETLVALKPAGLERHLG
jgi:ribose 1,5-bisphosphokinase